MAFPFHMYTDCSPSVHGDRDKCQPCAALHTAPTSTTESGPELKTVCGWLTRPSFPGGPSCLLATHLPLASGTSPDLTVSSREDDSAPAGTPCSAKPDRHPTWRKYLVSGMRNRCPDSQGQGWLDRGGQVTEVAADWTARLEREGRTGKAAAGKEEGRSPADAKKTLKLICTDQLQSPQRISLNPYHSTPPILSWLLIFTKKKCLRLAGGAVHTCDCLTYLVLETDLLSQVMLPFPFTRVALEMGTSFLNKGEGVCLRKTGCCEKGKRDNVKSPGGNKVLNQSCIH